MHPVASGKGATGGVWDPSTGGNQRGAGGGPERDISLVNTTHTGVCWSTCHPQRAGRNASSSWCKPHTSCVRCASSLSLYFSLSHSALHVFGLLLGRFVALVDNSLGLGLRSGESCNRVLGVQVITICQLFGTRCFQVPCYVPLRYFPF